MSLENLVKTGQLEKEPTDRGEIERFLGKISQRINDAAARTVSLDSTFDIGYEGVLQIALVALRAEGYRVRNVPGHQQTAIQSLTLTLGISAPEMLVFDVYRRNRSKSLYGAGHEPTEAEVRDFIKSATALHATLMNWLKAKHPELL